MDSFYITIWPPISNRANEIHTLISEHFKCSEVKRFTVHSDDFLEFTQMLYQTDKRCHKPYLIEKVKYMKHNYDLNNENKFSHYPISIIKYETNNPEYQYGISAQAVSIKEQLRKMLIAEIKEYIRDIIVHITDNPEDTKNAEITYNKFSNKFLSKRLFDSLSDKRYVIMKLDDRFPNYNSGDIDILTDNINVINETISKYCNFLQDGTYSFNISNASDYPEFSTESGRIFIDIVLVSTSELLFRYDIHRIDYNGIKIPLNLYFTFDSKMFLTDVLISSELKTINEIPIRVPYIKHDYAIRLLEYVKYPHKRKHLISVVKYIYSEYNRTNGEIFESDLVEPVLLANNIFKKNINDYNDIPNKTITMYFNLCITQVITKWISIDGIKLKDLYCRVHDKENVDKFNKFFNDNKKENESLNDFVERDVSNFNILNKLASQIYNNIKLSDSPIIEMIINDNFENVNIDNDLFTLYHNVDTNFVMADTKNTNYTKERLYKLYNDMKISINIDYGVKIIFSEENPTIYDGHHRCSILYKLYGEDFKIYPNMYMKYIIDIKDINDYEDKEFVKIVNELNLINNNNMISIPLIFFL